jgi:hypothetical protein
MEWVIVLGLLVAYVLLRDDGTLTGARAEDATPKIDGISDILKTLG